jgi:ABC-type Zn uptake system ZnuABC Zn-binding protein ZnuA
MNPRIRLGSKGYFDVSPYVQVVEVPLPVTRGQGIHPLGNPHYWLDPENGRRMARAITARLSLLHPNDAPYFEQRLASFNSRLAVKEQLWEYKMRPYRGYKVVSYHKAWGNFLKRYQLESIGEIELYPGIPPDEDHTDALIREMQRQKVRVILVEPPYKLTSPRKVAAATSARVLVLPGSVGGVPQASDYFSLIDYDVNSLIKAFH